jgi:hypothetical protein
MVNETVGSPVVVVEVIENRSARIATAADIGDDQKHTEHESAGGA